MRRPPLPPFRAATTINLTVEMELPNLLEAPIAAGVEIGALRLSLYDEEVYTAPLVALHDVEEAGFVGKTGDFLQLFFTRLFE